MTEHEFYWLKQAAETYEVETGQDKAYAEERAKVIKDKYGEMEPVDAVLMDLYGEDAVPPTYFVEHGHAH
jgi:hypothetical protein